jgi:hypothetical protein
MKRKERIKKWQFKSGCEKQELNEKLEPGEFSFGYFDDLPEISRKNFLDSLKKARHSLSLEKQGKIDEFLRKINLEYLMKEDVLDLPIKKMECELYLESLKPKT